MSWDWPEIEITDEFVERELPSEVSVKAVHGERSA